MWEVLELTTSRYEYSPSREEFSIHMPGLLHDTFSLQLHDLITLQRHDITRGVQGYKATSSELKEAAAKIFPSGSARIIFPDARGRMAPDQGYYYLSCKQSEPSLVIEINWSHFTSEKLAESKGAYPEIWY